MDSKLDFKRKLIAFVTLIIMIFSSGCSKDVENTQNLVVALEYGIDKLDPAYLRQLNEQYVACNIWEGLVRKNVKGSVEPGIAERWEMSEDGLKYIFYLRKNAKWSDGKAVTAKQYEYAWKRALDPKKDSSIAFMMYYLKNGQAYNKNKARVDDVGVKAIDNYTLEVLLEKPTPYFFEILNYHTYYPVRQDIIEKDPDWNTKSEMLVSNGPFYIESWDKNKEIRTVKNPYYWDEKNVKLNSITYQIGRVQDDEIWAKYLDGEVDFGYGFPKDDNFNLLNEIATGKNNVISRNSLATHYLCFNTRKAPFNNIKVRQAFELALDRNGFVKERQKGEEVATGFVPPGIQDANPGSDFRLNGGEYMHKEFVSSNLEEAKKLLNEAGYSDLKSFPTVVVVAKNIDGVQYIKSGWKKLGINVVMDVCKSELFTQKTNNGEFDIIVNNWIADIADPINFLGLIANENAFKGIFPSEYYSLIEKSNSAVDNGIRLDLLHNAEKILLESYSLIPLTYRKDVYYIKPYVKNYLKTPLAEIYFRNAYIEK